VRNKEFVVETLIRVAGLSAIFIVALIFLFLLREGAPAFHLHALPGKGRVPVFLLEDTRSGEVFATTAEANRGPTCARDPEGRLRLTTRCGVLLSAVGLVVGLLSGLFGVGGGFLIVPGLVTFASMGLTRAVGTSLLVMALVGTAGVAGQLAEGRVIPLDVTLGFLAGSIPALFAGSILGRRLPGPVLAKVFAVAMLGVGLFVIARTLLAD